MNPGCFGFIFVIWQEAESMFAIFIYANGLNIEREGPSGHRLRPSITVIDSEESGKTQGCWSAQVCMHVCSLQVFFFFFFYHTSKVTTGFDVSN